VALRDADPVATRALYLKKDRHPRRRIIALRA